MPSFAKRIGLTVFVLIFCNALSTAQTASTLEGRRKALNNLLGDQWEYRLRSSPIFSSFLGDKRWNDQLDDFSHEAIC